MYSPLEQFDIFPIAVISLPFFNIHITNMTAYLFLTLFIITVLFSFPISKYKILPNNTQILTEKIYDFIYNIVLENLGRHGKVYFALLLSLFIYIVTINLVGMVPYTFTPTSHVGIAFGLSFLFFIGFTTLGASLHRLDYLNNFFPKGTPYEMSPLLVPIEIISHVSKAFSLGIRLFANMMSGHTLLKIIGGFACTMLLNGGMLAILGILPFILLFILTGLECGIAILQGYVFTVLCTLYITDSVNLH